LYTSPECENTGEKAVVFIFLTEDSGISVKIFVCDANQMSVQYYDNVLSYSDMFRHNNATIGDNIPRPKTVTTKPFRTQQIKIYRVFLWGAFTAVVDNRYIR
jgi:hypothetical protein